jgi:hypothetical protein
MVVFRVDFISEHVLKFVSSLMWTKNVALLWTSDFQYNTHESSLLDTVVNLLSTVNVPPFF